MTKSSIRLEEIVDDAPGKPNPLRRVETLVVAVADVVAVRYSAKFTSGDFRDLCDVEMRDGRRYTVRGTMSEVAERIWPSPALCKECGRPKQ